MYVSVCVSDDDNEIVATEMPYLLHRGSVIGVVGQIAELGFVHRR